VWDRAAQDRRQPRVRSCGLGRGREELQERCLFATWQQGRILREELVGIEAAGGEGVRKGPLHRHENVCEIGTVKIVKQLEGVWNTAVETNEARLLVVLRRTNKKSPLPGVEDLSRRNT
jgi:hypothetical protein